MLPGDRCVESREHMGSCSADGAYALLQQGMLHVKSSPKNRRGCSLLASSPVCAEHKQTLRTRLLKSHGFT